MADDPLWLAYHKQAVQACGAGRADTYPGEHRGKPLKPIYAGLEESGPPRWWGTDPSWDVFGEESAVEFLPTLDFSQPYMGGTAPYIIRS